MQTKCSFNVLSANENDNETTLSNTFEAKIRTIKTMTKLKHYFSILYKALKLIEVITPINNSKRAPN